MRKRGPGKIVLAVPVAPSDTLEEIRGDADEIVCLEDYEFFRAIGAYYSDFRQVTDEELISTLARCGQPTTASTGRNMG